MIREIIKIKRSKINRKYTVLSLFWRRRIPSRFDIQRIREKARKKNHFKSDSNSNFYFKDEKMFYVFQYIIYHHHLIVIIIININIIFLIQNIQEYSPNNKINIIFIFLACLNHQQHRFLLQPQKQRLQPTTLTTNQPVSKPSHWTPFTARLCVFDESKWIE